MLTDSPIRDLISQSILKLKEDQVLEKLKEDWWKKDGIVNKCPEVEKEKSNAHALQLQNVAGIFFILIGGILLAFITAGFEYMLHSNQSGSKVLHLTFPSLFVDVIVCTGVERFD